MSDVNAAPWQPLPEEPWGVFVPGLSRLYLAFDKSGDERAGRPFTEAEARELATQITGVAYPVPVLQTLQPGV